MMKRAGVSCLALLAGCAVAPRDAPDACGIAALYLDAANSGEAGRLAPHLSDEVTAIFLPEDDAPLSAMHGRDEVLEAVRTYTAQCPSCRSSSRCLHATGAAVYAMEDVVFVDQDGIERRQSAPLVIELDGGRIRTIIYYPATRTD